MEFLTRNTLNTEIDKLIEETSAGSTLILISPFVAFNNEIEILLKQKGTRKSACAFNL